MSLSKIARSRYFLLGLCVFAVFILQGVIIMTRAPEAAAGFSVNGMIAVFLSFVVIAVSGAKKCCSRLVMAIVFLINIGVCAQCVISSSPMSKQTLLLAVSSAAGMASFLLWDRLSAWAERMPSWSVLALTAGLCAVMYISLLLFGTRHNGTKAWLEVGKMSVQLTETAKLAAVAFYALLYSRGDISEKHKTICSFAFLVFNAAMLAAIGELGTLLVIVLVFSAMSFLFIGSRRLTALTFCALAAALLTGIAAVMILDSSARETIANGGEPGALQAMAHRLSGRVAIWLRSDAADPSGTGYQSLRARYAIMVGGAFGSPYYVYVPTGSSDFIFPSLILRFGLLTGITVVLLFFTLFYYGIRIYLNLSRPLEITMCAGCVLCIVLQAMVMIFGSTNFFIMTGVPVPFLSEGGTAQTVAYIMAGMLVRFSRGMEAERHGK